jgi:hypothetical protein
LTFWNRLDHPNVPVFLRINRWAGGFLAALLGGAVILLPGVGVPVHPEDVDYFFPFLVTAFGQLSWKSAYPPLAGIGFVIAFVSSARYWEVGLATIAILPAWMIVDIFDAYVFDHIERHNLFPFELALYTFYALPGIAGAFTAKAVLLGVFGAKSSN